MAITVSLAREPAKHHWNRIWRWLFLFLFVAGACYAGSRDNAPMSVAQSDASDPTPLGFIDPTQGRYFIIQLAQTQPDYQFFSAAIPGVGLFGSAGAAQIDVQNDSAQLSYSGDAFLDAAAQLDPELVYNTTPSGQVTPVTIQFLAQVDLVQHTGNAQLTHNGQIYDFVISAPSSSTDASLEEVVESVRQQDWSRLYNVADRQLRDNVAQTEFAARSANDLQSLGTVRSIRVLMASIYTIERWGYRTATAVLELTTANGDVESTRWLQAAFIYDGGVWRFNTFFPTATDQLLVVAGGPYTVAEGQSVAVAATPFNPNNEALIYAWDLDNDGSFEANGQGVSFSAVSLDGPATRTIRVRATGGGGASAVGQTTVTVINAAPAAAFAAPAGVAAGQSFTLGLGNPQDVAADRPTLQYAFDCGDGLGDGPFSATPSRGCPTAAAGTRAVRGTVRDKDGGQTAYTASVVVTGANAAPVVGPLDLPAPVAVGGSVALAATFADPDPADSHTATWAWGDGTTSAGGVTPAAGGGSVAGGHAYAAPGLYPVSVTVADSHGGSGSATTQGYVVVYDPAGGFVTGGGWLTAPVGACQQPAACAGAGGKATLSVNAKYHNGATVPTGNAQYKVGSFDVRATAYGWLVVADGVARLQGSATVNGAGGYSFLLTVADGAAAGGGTDRARLRVWHAATGALVYDTEPGAPDTAAPATPLGGGAIVIHGQP